jgi:hypothetical protein
VCVHRRAPATSPLGSKEFVRCELRGFRIASSETRIERRVVSTANSAPHQLADGPDANIHHVIDMPRKADLDAPLESNVAHHALKELVLLGRNM